MKSPVGANTDAFPTVKTVAANLSDLRNSPMREKSAYPSYPKMALSITKAFVEMGFSLTYATFLAGIFGFFGVGRGAAENGLTDAEKELLESYYGTSSGALNWPMAVGFYNDLVDHVTTVHKKGMAHGVCVITGFSFAFLSVFSSLKVSYDSLDYEYFNEHEILKRFLVAFFALSVLSTGAVSVTNTVEDIIKTTRAFVDSHREKYKHHYKLLSDFEATLNTVEKKIKSGEIVYDFKSDGDISFPVYHYQLLSENQISSARTVPQTALNAVRWYLSPAMMTLLCVTAFTPVWFKMTEDGMNALGQIDWFKTHFEFVFGDAEQWGTESPYFTASAAFSRILMYTYSPVKFIGVFLDYIKTISFSAPSVICNLVLAALAYGSGSGIAEEVKKMIDPAKSSAMMNATGLNHSNYFNHFNTTNATNPYAGFGLVADDIFFSQPILNALYSAIIRPWAVICATILTGNVINYRSSLLFLMAAWKKQEANNVSFLRAAAMHMFNGKFAPLTSAASEVVEQLKHEERMVRAYVTVLYYLLNPAAAPANTKTVEPQDHASVSVRLSADEQAKAFVTEANATIKKLEKALQKRDVTELPNAEEIRDARQHWVDQDNNSGFIGAVGRCFRKTVSGCCASLFGKKQSDINYDDLSAPINDARSEATV